MNIKLILKDVTLGFSDIAAPKDFKGNVRWGTNVIIEPTSTACIRPIDGAKKEWHPALAFINKQIKLIADAEFGGKIPQDSAFRDGNENISKDTNEPYEGYAGKFYIASYRQTITKKGNAVQPPLITNARLQAVRPGEAGFPQSGDVVTIVLDLYTQGGKSDKLKEYGRRINSSFETVQFMRRGLVSYGGGSAPSTIGLDAAEEEDPTAEL